MSTRTRTRTRRLRTSVAASIVGSLALLTSACGSDDATPASDSITIDDAWSRRPVEGQTTSAVYGVLGNDGDEAVTAVGASSDVSDTVELHEVVMNDDGTMTMRERTDGYEVPAGGETVLEPGGLHIMVLDIDPATYPDQVDVAIEFDDGSTLAVTAEVRDVDGTMNMDETDMGGMDMDETDDSEMDDG